MLVNFESKINSIKFSSADSGTAYNFTLSVFRSILAYAATSAITIVENLKDESNEGILAECASKLLRPSDGDFVFILDSLLPIMWANQMQHSTTTWFSEGVSKLCNQIIFERNNRLGHGVFDRTTASKSPELLTQIETILNCLKSLIPESKDGKLIIGSADFPIPLPSDDLYCVREISKRANGWRVRYQLLDIDDSTEQILFLTPSSMLPQLVAANRSILMSKKVSDGWTPMFVLPNRQTSIFLGRSHELDHLVEWWDDEFSRVCLIYGEGGIGKTTLALEFLNNVLDNEFDVSWKPEYIFFFSSKQTRWGLNGLEIIPGVEANLSEALRRLIASLEVVDIDSKWYVASVKELIDRSSQVINELGLKGKILLIVDNAENLVLNKSEEEELAASLKLISRKIGRVIVTSRRREQLEAEPVNVVQLSNEDATNLLARLASEYGVVPIPDREKLRECVIRIGCKPILVEFLAKYAAVTKMSLDRGVQEILKQESSHLGEFLFADGWGRISSGHQKIFIVAAQVGGVIDDTLLTYITDAISERKEEWLSSFEETRYGELTYYGNDFELILDEGARSFISGRYQGLPKDERKSLDEAAMQCRKQYAAYLAAQRSEVHDRVEKAFVHPLARQAKLAVKKGDLTSAENFYSQAIISDASNAYLFDRFAMFKMKMLRDLDGAENLARHAVTLEKDDPEVNFTMGLILTRQGRVKDADHYLGIAKRRGKEKYLVNLQMAYARYTALWKKMIMSDEVVRLETEALLEAAIIGEPKTTEQFRHNYEVKALAGKLKTHFKHK